MTTGPAGSTSYSDPNHVHAATQLATIPNQYAAYDAMGNLTCRNVDTTSGHTCGSSPTGAVMTYDNEGRLATWAAPSGTTATDSFLYDNEGNRVLQRVSASSVSDTITFDGYTETVRSGGTTTTTKYYSINGQRLALKVSGTLSYLLNDGLSSVNIAVTSAGSTQAVQLFAPYGALRYSQGTMPTTYNFTGQRVDSEMGLLYYNFRYYDPLSGRFVRADTTQTNAGGMDPYAYVGDNPETKNDPTGHVFEPAEHDYGGGVNTGGGSGEGEGGSVTIDGVTYPTMEDALKAQEEQLKLDEEFAALQAKDPAITNATDSTPPTAVTNTLTNRAAYNSDPEEFVRNNVGTILPPEAGPLDLNKPTFKITGDRVVGTTNIDVNTEFAVTEVGGPSKFYDPAGNLNQGRISSFYNQIQKYIRYAASVGKPYVYFAYFGAPGTIPQAVLNVLSKWGVEVIYFTVP